MTPLRVVVVVVPVHMPHYVRKLWTTQSMPSTVAPCGVEKVGYEGACPKVNCRDS